MAASPFSSSHFLAPSLCQPSFIPYSHRPHHFIWHIDRELVYLLVTRENTPFYSYAEQFIMVGPVLDGFVGGLSAFNGVVHA